MFDVTDPSVAVAAINECRMAFPNHYVKVNGFDSSKGRQTTMLSFIVNRPKEEPGFSLERTEGQDRRIQYSIRPKRRILSRIVEALWKLKILRASATASETTDFVDVSAAHRDSKLEEMLNELDCELVGLKSVKSYIRRLASLLLVSQLREKVGLSTQHPTLHMSFTGHPGTGKTTVAKRMGMMLNHLGYLRRGHLVVATRDDLVGQFVGHTAPKTKETIKKAMGGVLFIDEAYYLYRPENERDYGQEAIEMLLQVMEEKREDLVVILAGYPERMATFFQYNPGFRSRVAHHIDFPDYTAEELIVIAE